jgi:hypothetical protein
MKSTTFETGDRVRVVWGRYRGQVGLVDWVSGIRGPNGRLVGVQLDGRLLGFGHGELRKLRRRVFVACPAGARHGP